jgi:hypothetical protein
MLVRRSGTSRHKISTTHFRNKALGIIMVNASTAAGDATRAFTLYFLAGGRDQSGKKKGMT